MISASVTSACFHKYDKQPRQGSLPLKKRQFQPFKETLLQPASTSVEASETRLPLVKALSSKEAEVPNPRYTSVEMGSTALSALAVVAASSQESRLSDIPSHPTNVTVNETKTDIDELSADSSKEECDESTCIGEQDDLIGRTPSGRARHRPLLEPLPGGCHGKNIRQNSYCRRLPCYNGSQYCKLHYKQYVVRGKGPSFQEDVSLNSGRASKLKAKSGPSETLAQDRRYMGGAGETRCAAITTRGRVCAYIAIGETKYCNLHADYDTNPPPRRSSSGTQRNERLCTSRLQAHANDVPSEVCFPAPVSVSEDSIDSARLTPFSESEVVVKPRRASGRRISTKMKEMISEAQFPLLSMISTEKWAQKSVRIAAGPFEGRSGEVRKWGNGWVTVSIPGVGLHNRRSFELYLNVSEPSEDTEGKPCVSDNRSTPSPLPPNFSKTRSQAAAGEESHAVMITPRPIKAQVLLNTARKSDSDDAKTPVGDSATMPFNTVTPSLSSRGVVPEPVHLPLSDNIFLQPKNGVSSNFKLDMLFGSDASGSGRGSARRLTRTHVPSSTQPNIPRKRSRIHSEEKEQEVTKKQRNAI